MPPTLSAHCGSQARDRQIMCIELAVKGSRGDDASISLIRAAIIELIHLCVPPYNTLRQRNS